VVWPHRDIPGAHARRASRSPHRVSIRRRLAAGWSAAGGTLGDVSARAGSGDGGPRAGGGGHRGETRPGVESRGRHRRHGRRGPQPAPGVLLRGAPLARRLAPGARRGHDLPGRPLRSSPARGPDEPGALSAARPGHRLRAGAALAPAAHGGLLRHALRRLVHDSPHVPPARRRDAP
jgi:hypothetical protein